jgi:hypothetical protein
MIHHIKKHQKHARKHIDKRLRSRLRLYLILAAVMVGIVISNWLRHRLSLEFSIIDMVAGVMVGIISSRMFHISWDHDAQKVVSQMDLLGGIVLGTYIVFEITREVLFNHYLASLALAATLAFAAGTMIGRVLGTRGKIVKILREQGVFHK